MWKFLENGVEKCRLVSKNVIFFATWMGLPSYYVMYKMLGADEYYGHGSKIQRMAPKST